jgi:hypothetical protein
MIKEIPLIVSDDEDPVHPGVLEPEPGEQQRQQQQRRNVTTTGILVRKVIGSRNFASPYFQKGAYQQNLRVTAKFVLPTTRNDEKLI